MVDAALKPIPTRSSWSAPLEVRIGSRNEDGGGLVACCEVRYLGGDTAEFGMFAVSPDRQGGGWGAVMLDEAERIGPRPTGVRPRWSCR